MSIHAFSCVRNIIGCICLHILTSVLSTLTYPTSPTPLGFLETKHYCSLGLSPFPEVVLTSKSLKKDQGLDGRRERQAVPSHTTLRSGHPLDEAVSDSICHITHNHFPPELEPPKSLNQETKDDSSALRFCRIVRPPQDLDQEHQGTCLLSLFLSPPHPRHFPSPSFSPLLSFISLYPRLVEFLWQVCLGWQNGVKVRERR